MVDFVAMDHDVDRGIAAWEDGGGDLARWMMVLGVFIEGGWRSDACCPYGDERAEGEWVGSW